MKKSSIIYVCIPIIAASLFPLISCKSAESVQKEETVVQQQVDPYTGWKYVAEQNLSITNGNVKIEMNGDLGTFCLYAVNRTGSDIPLLATRDSKTASYFSLMVDRTVYPLLASARVKPESRRTPYGAQMVYTVAGTVQVVVDFSFMPSIISSDFVDMLRVTVYTINIGIETHTVCIKALFDTVLGESFDSHFSTAVEEKINSGRQYETMARDKWITSSDNSTSIQFLLYGNGISIPHYVTLTNKDLLAGAWVPVVAYGQGFHTVHSYNNSAIGINYTPTSLGALKSDVKTFFLAIATDGNTPKGEAFLASLESGKTSLPVYDSKETDKQTEEVPSLPELDAIHLQDNALDDDFLYAQRLVEKIKALDEADEKELDRLNKELDEVLLRLQSK